MEKNNLIKRLLPYIVAAGIFLLASIIYCAPELEGKRIQAGDEVSFKGASAESVNYRNSTGDITWWTGSMFSGMPNYQVGGGTYLSTKLMMPLWKITHPSASNLYLVFMTFFCCFFIMFRAFGIEKWLSMIGAFATGFSSYFFIIEAAGHHTKAWSIMLMSVVVGGFFLIYKKKYGWGIPLVMLFTAMGFTPHPQMFYYMMMLIGILFLCELYIHVKEKRYKDFAISTAFFMVSVLVGMGTGTSNVFANSEYVKETMRGGHSEITVSAGEEKKQKSGLDIDYATQWSYGLDETLTFLIPGYMGCATGYDVGSDSDLYKTLTDHRIPSQDAKNFCKRVPAYWGEQPFTVGSVYMGAAVCFFFILALFLVKGPYKWGLLAATIFSVLLSWGHNFMWLTQIFFDYFPMYNKFRSVTSILIVAEITMPLLGFLALKEIMEGGTDRAKFNKALSHTTIIVGGICLVLALFGGSICSFTSTYDASFKDQLPEWLYRGILDERRNILRADSWRSLLFVLLSAGVTWTFFNKRLKKEWFILLLGVIVFADMWPVNRRYLNGENFVNPKRDNTFAMQPYEKAILQDKDPHFRVMNLTTSTFNDARTSYRLKSIGGYSAAKLRRYQDVIDMYLSKVDIDVISMLNGKYIITSDSKGEAVPQLNPYAMGNAWFVDTVKIVQSPLEECAALGSINLRTTAVLDGKFAGYVCDFKPARDTTATVRLESYSPKKLTYTASSRNGGTAVFSEIYYPYGWKATIDGEKADIFRVNYILRAMNIPAGSHRVEMVFDPDSVKKGNLLSCICVGIMYLTILSILGYSISGFIRKRKKIEEI